MSKDASNADGPAICMTSKCKDANDDADKAAPFSSY